MCASIEISRGKPDDTIDLKNLTARLPQPLEKIAARVILASAI
jgi:hypothetical protein